jgi:hypothetical protein
LPPASVGELASRATARDPRMRGHATSPYRVLPDSDADSVMAIATTK